MKGFKRSETSGLFVPEKLPRKIGIGCPKCDQHFLQDPKLGQASAQGQAFIRKHGRCGPLDALEEIDGKVIATGPVEIRTLSS